MANFHESLSVGKVIENNVLGFVREKYPKSYIKEGYFKGYDIYVPEKDMGIEVKADTMSQQTGNLVVEIEFDGKPSALATTLAEWYVFYDGKCYIWIKPQELKRISEKYGKLREFVGNGDTKSKKAYLIKKNFVKDNAKKVYYL